MLCAVFCYFIRSEMIEARHYRRRVKKKCENVICHQRMLLLLCKGPRQYLFPPPPTIPYSSTNIDPTTEKEKYGPNAHTNSSFIA